MFSIYLQNIDTKMPETWTYTNVLWIGDLLPPNLQVYGEFAVFCCLRYRLAEVIFWFVFDVCLLVY